jgi:hypothetical protein
MVVVTQLVREFTAVELKDALPYLKKAAIGPCPKPIQSSPANHTVIL